MSASPYSSLSESVSCPPAALISHPSPHRHPSVQGPWITPPSRDLLRALLPPAYPSSSFSPPFFLPTFLPFPGLVRLGSPPPYLLFVGIFHPTFLPLPLLSSLPQLSSSPPTPFTPPPPPSSGKELGCFYSEDECEPLCVHFALSKLCRIEGGREVGRRQEGGRFVHAKGGRKIGPKEGGR